MACGFFYMIFLDFCFSHQTILLSNVLLPTFRSLAQRAVKSGSALQNCRAINFQADTGRVFAPVCCRGAPVRLYRTPKSCVVASGSRLGWITDQPQTSLGSSSRRFARWEVWPYEVGPSRAPCLPAAVRADVRCRAGGDAGRLAGDGKVCGFCSWIPPAPERTAQKRSPVFFSLPRLTFVLLVLGTGRNLLVSDNGSIHRRAAPQSVPSPNSWESAELVSAGREGWGCRPAAAARRRRLAASASGQRDNKITLHQNALRLN